MLDVKVKNVFRWKLGGVVYPGFNVAPLLYRGIFVWRERNLRRSEVSPQKNI